MADSKKQLFRKWLITAPFGLVLVGAGLSVFGEALLIKWEQRPFWDWFWWGTAGLVLINAGISLVAQAVIFRVRYEHARK